MHKHFHEFISFNLKFDIGNKHFKKVFHHKRWNRSIADVIFKWFPLFSTRYASRFYPRLKTKHFPREAWNIF